MAIIVALDSTEHLLGEDETTVCGIVIPHGTTWSSDAAPANPCATCFPDLAEDKPAKNRPGAKAAKK